MKSVVGVDVAWLMERASGLSEQAFEHWYLGTHAEIAKRLPGLARYAVSRLVQDGLLDAPSDLDRTYRVAQLYWQDLGSAERSFSSYEGLATFGDNAVNTGDSSYVRGLSLTEEWSLGVLEPLRYDAATGHFLQPSAASGEPLGRSWEVVKVHGYGFGGGDGLDDYLHYYDARPAALGPHVRAHVVGRVAPRSMEVGALRVPPSGARAASWSVEWWFDTVEDARAAVESGPFVDAWERIRGETPEVFRGIYQAQELFRSACAMSSVA